MAQILCFGDSIIAGFWDSRGGWVSRLRQNFDQKTLEYQFVDEKTGIWQGNDFYYEVYNLGIAGDTTEDLLKRFNSDAEARRGEGEELIFIFAIGANDAQWLVAEKRLKVTPAQFEANIVKLMAKARSYPETKEIFFVGLTVMDENKLNPVPWAPEIALINKNVKAYDQIIKKVCQKQGVEFVEIWDEFEKLGKKALSKDGGHPSDLGHELIYKLVKKQLEEKLFVDHTPGV